MPKLTLKQFNAIAKAYDLELVKNRNYFYWHGLTERRGLQLSYLRAGTSIYTAHFNQPDAEYWGEELKTILDRIEKEDYFGDDWSKRPLDS